MLLVACAPRIFRGGAVESARRRGGGVVAQIDKLFAIDAQARREGLDQGARHSLRQQQAPLLLNELKARIEATLATALPASALGKACRYTLALWQKLTRFLDYPELELSNNLAENSMRRVALGRKNWKRHWERVTPFFAFPEGGAQDHLHHQCGAGSLMNMSLRKVLKPRSVFPSEEAALKVMYLALHNVIKKWERPVHWKAALNRFTLLWEDRIRIAIGG